MSLRHLKWLAVLAPLLFLAAVELARQVIAPDLFHAWPGYLLLAGIVLIGTLFFAETIFAVVDRLQARLAHQNRELLALHDAGLGMLGELDLETVLQRVVDRARILVGARYGSIIGACEPPDAAIGRPTKKLLPSTPVSPPKWPVASAVAFGIVKVGNTECELEK